MLVEDHVIERSAIRQAVTDAGIEVIAESSTAEEALEVAPVVHPDVMLIDVGLPGMSGLSLIASLAPRLRDTRMVMLTASSTQRDVDDAIRFGAVGYLTKDLTPEALVRSIRGAVEGELAMPRDRALRALQDFARHDFSGFGGLGALSPREAEVLRHVADGRTDLQIAAMLGLSVRTVERHVAGVLRKLSARNRTEAALRYWECRRPAG